MKNYTHHEQNDNSYQDAKKNWLKPDLEILSKDVIKNGNISTYPEGVLTPAFSYGSAS